MELSLCIFNRYFHFKNSKISILEQKILSIFDWNVFLMTGLDSISFFKTTKKFLRLNKLYDNPIAEILLESSSMPSNYTPLGHKATVKQSFLNHIFNITILNHVTARNYNFIETLIYY